MACDVCNMRPEKGVCCVPMMPISMAYCQECLNANAHPWDLLVGTAWQIGGLENGNEGFKAMVKDTCTHLGKTEAEFLSDVEKLTAEIDADLSPPDGAVN